MQVLKEFWSKPRPETHAPLGLESSVKNGGGPGKKQSLQGLRRAGRGSDACRVFREQATRCRFPPPPPPGGLYSPKTLRNSRNTLLRPT